MFYLTKHRHLGHALLLIMLLAAAAAGHAWGSAGQVVTEPLDQPIVLSEFGGITFAQDPDRTWGYSRAATAEDFSEKYTRLLEAVRSSNVLAGFCYTQFADTYQEANGLLHADRTPKIPIENIRNATRGPTGRAPLEAEWRERLMQAQRTQYLIPAEDYRTHSDR